MYRSVCCEIKCCKTCTYLLISYEKLCLCVALAASDWQGSPSFIVAHPDFRMIVLANRPGFPFLGNDFFGAMGTYVVLCV